MLNITHTMRMDQEAGAEQHTITMKGHADYDDNGKDIVCAAASFLIQTFAHVMSKWEEFTPGDVAITVTFPSGDDWAQGVLDTTLSGLRLLAISYPGHVSMTG